MLGCMRITIRIPDPLHAAAKDLALRTGRTLSAVVQDALREWIAKCQDGPPAARTTLLHEGKGGIRPGVNLNNSAQLLDVMEGRDGLAES